MKFFTHLLLLICLLLSPNIFSREIPTCGDWIGKLQLNDTTELPFRMAFTEYKGAPSLTIKNGEEVIHLSFRKYKGDTLIYTFPEFNSDLFLLVTSKKTIKGYWHDLNKKGKYTIPLGAHFCSGTLFECSSKKSERNPVLKNKWKTVFDPNSPDAFHAIGLFNQKDSLLSGTFLTETGDFRFLDGNFFGNQLYLSCFDGTHAFLFTATLKNDTLNGDFYSGTHYKTTWVAHADEQYELTDPTKLTYVVNDKTLNFDFNDINLKNFHYPNADFANKVTIIQIMGSWCPNCIDETLFFMELYEKYHNQGLEIILIGYETGADENEYISKLKRLQNRHSIPFTILVGGAASKNKASIDFPMLNQIMSFPTSIFLDREGNIQKIHTGFNGPGTGQYYNEYIIQTESFIKELLTN